MGRIAVPAVLESIEDLYRVQRGDLRAEQVRRIEVADALIDTGATALSLPKRMIAQLGLLPLRPRQAMTPAGIQTVATFGAVLLSVHGRDCLCDVAEIDDACPVLIGQVPLELMDFLVDPGGRQLIGNPAHGGQQVMELM